MAASDLGVMLGACRTAIGAFGGSRGVAALCIGGGMGIAMVVQVG